jgi:hypothetical protein
MSLTLAIASPTIAKGLQVCDDDPRVARYINEGTERLLSMGRWAGCDARYNICINSGILTLPMELRTCLSASRINSPLKVRNQWFEFIGSGPGPQGACNGSGYNLHDRGDGHVTLADIRTTSTLRIYADVVESPTATITIMGYDENNNPVRTQPNGIWQDGETITINPTSPATFQTSAFSWNGITQIVKPLTNGTIRLYAVDTDEHQTLLGLYGPNIKTPTFRRYELAGWGEAKFCDILFTICKRRFIPVSEPNDQLIIQNLAALKDMTKSIQMSEADNVDACTFYENKALTLLDNDLREHLGDTGGVADIQIPGFMGHSCAML